MCAHAVGVWGDLKSAYSVKVTGIIVDEARFYQDPDTRQRQPMQLEAEIGSGAVSRLDASLEEMASLASIFTPDVLDALGPGESEALAIALNRPEEEFQFVSGDGLAIECFVMAEQSERLASMDTLLQAIGRTRSLPHQFREAFLERHRRLGAIRRIQGDGVRAEGLD